MAAVAAEPTVHQRMVAILADLPAIGKDQRNEQQNFMFRGHDDVLNALNPLLAKHGVYVVPEMLERIVAQRTTRNGAVMFEVNLHVRFTFFGAGGDSVTGSTWGEGTDMGDKATNKAMTMAFKAVLNQSFAISNKEASDSDAETPENTVHKPAVETAPSSPAMSQGTTPPATQAGTDAANAVPASSLPATNQPFIPPTEQRRSEPQAKMLHSVLPPLVKLGHITDEAFINAAAALGAEGDTVNAVIDSLSKASASSLISRLKTLAENHAKAAA